MPESDFETFVRERLNTQGESLAHMADALWDIIPRVDKLERVQGRHGEMLRDHAALLRDREDPRGLTTAAASIPPPKGLGVQTVTGSWKFTDADLDAWQKKKDGEALTAKWNAILAGSWKVLLVVAGAEAVHWLIGGHL